MARQVQRRERCRRATSCEMLERRVVLAAAAAGELDAGFGSGGHVVVDLPPQGQTAEDVGHVLLQADGKIVVPVDYDDGRHYGLLRFDRDGSLDETFSGDGVALTTAQYEYF